MILPPKQAFKHELQYFEIDSFDDWGEQQYKPAVTFYGRVDLEFPFQRASIQATDDLPSALITTQELLNFKPKNKINFDGLEFTIVNVVPLYDDNTEVFIYELEVM